jgi:hypothetical protein
MVPVLRKGRIWTVWTGTTRVDMVAPKIRHASTDGDSQAQHRGKVTDAAVDTDAGQENSAAPDGVLMGNQGMSGAIVLELNLPAG